MDCTCTKYRYPHLKVTNEKGSVCVLVRSSTGELMDTAAIRRENERRKTLRYRMGALARRLYTRLTARLETLRSAGQAPTPPPPGGYPLQAGRSLKFRKRT